MISGEFYFKANKGELFQQLCGESSKTTATIRKEFWNFLTAIENKSHSPNIHSAINASQERLSELQKVRTTISKHLRSQRVHLSNGVLQSVINKYHEVKADITCKLLMLKEKLGELRNGVDGELMELVLNYFDILKKEISFNRFSTNTDYSDINAQRKMAENNKKMKYFALCVGLETSNKVQVASLGPTSSQSKRCMKAVIENINPELMNSLGFVALDVNAVYKLDHSILSTKLQDSATAVASGKIKGLFCMVSTDNIHKFCLYGISDQALFSHKSTTSNMLSMGLSKIDPADIYSTPWYCCGNISMQENGFDGFGTLSSRSRVKISTVLKKSFGAAKRLAENNSIMKLRFSRQSTTSSLLNQGLGENSVLQQDGVFICLCRVLICKAHTVMAEPTDQDIMKAVEDNCDAILINTTQEYVLLNANYVLPEFLMRANFKMADANAATCMQERVKKSLVVLPNACSHYPSPTKAKIPVYSRQRYHSNTSPFNEGYIPDKLDEITKVLNDTSKFSRMHGDTNKIDELTENDDCREDEGVHSQSLQSHGRVSSCAAVFSNNVFHSNRAANKFQRKELIGEAIHNANSGEALDSPLPLNSGSSNLTDIDMESLAVSLAEFDSRSALSTKQSIVRSIQTIVQDYKKERQEVISSIFCRGV